MAVRRMTRSVMPAAAPLIGGRARGHDRPLLGTSERFPRRLIAERRIRFVRVGRHVRIPASAVGEFVEAGLVEPTSPGGRGRVA
jgi:excisionase family DNA binding protein